MTAKPFKIGATLLVLGLAFGGLMYSTLSEGTEFYRQGKRLQLHGFVVEKSILRRPDTLDYRFQVQSNGKVLPVRYTGVVPDTFKDGAEVVLKGRLGPDGFAVDKDGVMAKCPSKYNAQSPAGNAGS
jgi:cytochrome c-type biogenesis protein CcmE